MEPKCPKCGGNLVVSTMDLDVYIKKEKAGTVENVTVLCCDQCEYDGFVLEVTITTEGIFLGEE